MTSFIYYSIYDDLVYITVYICYRLYHKVPRYITGDSMILTFHGKLIASGVQGSAYRYGKSLTIDFFTIFSNKNFFTILPYNIHSGNILPTPGGVRSQALKLFLVPDRAVRSWF